MQIHYFQRYHSKENVDTANAMLLLSRLYTFSSSKFYYFLANYILPENSDTEPRFVLQEKFKVHEKDSHTIPDAIIEQKSFKIAIETKLHGQFDVEQLINHLSAFDESIHFKVLLTIDPNPMDLKIKEDFESSLKNYNQKLSNPVLHKNITFEYLIESIKSVIDERDYEFSSILNDYEEYCFSQKLIPDEWRWMRAVTAGATFDINKKLNVYYDNAERGFSGHEYIGLYTQKSIRAIGKIEAIITATDEDGFKFICEKGKFSDNHKKVIEEAVSDAKNYGYDMKSERYFFVEKFYETNYRKTTPNPIQGKKFIDLTEILGIQKLPSTEEIADILKTKTWG